MMKTTNWIKRSLNTFQIRYLRAMYTKPDLRLPKRTRHSRSFNSIKSCLEAQQDLLRNWTFGPFWTADYGLSPNVRMHSCPMLCCSRRCLHIFSHSHQRSELRPDSTQTSTISIEVRIYRKFNYSSISFLLCRPIRDDFWKPGQNTPISTILPNSATRSGIFQLPLLSLVFFPPSSDCIPW